VLGAVIAVHQEGPHDPAAPVVPNRLLCIPESAATEVGPRP
jgi:hypothetical protein